MYAPGPVAVPPGVVTIIFFAPRLVPAGVTAVIVVALTMVKLVTGTPSIVTPVAPVKFVPVIVMEVPPESVPDDGETETKVGTTAVVKVATGE